MAQERPDPRIGTVLNDKYRLVSVLGSGGMATVFHAVHRNRADFAIKMLHPELSRRADLRERFLREGYIANSIKHPAIVRVVDDAVAEDGAAFLVMDLIDGISVEDASRKGGSMTVAAAISILDQLLDVLAAAHARGIVHRDIKPANLFLSRSGELRVLDFGIARVREAALDPTLPGRVETESGMLLGTPAFMSPEQALGKSALVDARTDLWAAGATFFVLAGGRTVHAAETSQEMLVRAATTPAPLLSTVAADVPPAVAAVIDRALAFERDARWADAELMQRALRRACGDESVEASDRRAVARVVQTALERRADGAALAATVASDAVGPFPARHPGNGSVSASGIAEPLESGRHRTAGPTTELPVSVHLVSEAATGRTRSRRPALVGAGVAALVVVAAMGALVAHRTTPLPPPAVPPALATSPPPTPSAEGAPPSATSVAPAPIASAASSSAAPSSAASAAVAPSVVARPRSAPSTTKPARMAPAVRGCDPPYTIDARGIRTFRPECAVE